jgi:hypothetical protein
MEFIGVLWQKERDKYVLEKEGYGCVGTAW